MIEEWKVVKGYEGLYEVSNLGRIKSLRTGRIREASKHDGSTTRYATYLLRKNGIIKSMAIHRIVAEAFIPNPNNYPQINHKDENTFNNRVDNLEWCTNIYNIQYGTGINRKAEAKRNKNIKKVAQYDKHGNLLRVWDNARKASEETKIHYGDIITACKGYYMCHNIRHPVFTSHGYIWKYV